VKLNQGLISGHPSFSTDEAVDHSRRLEERAGEGVSFAALGRQALDPGHLLSKRGDPNLVLSSQESVVSVLHDLARGSGDRWTIGAAEGL
jgi:hypothetical protein